MPPASCCRLLQTLGCIAILGGVATVTTAQVQPADQLSRQLDELSGLQEIPAERVVRFSVLDDDLSVSSDLKLADGQRQLRIKGLPGISTVQVGRQSRRGMGPNTYLELFHAGDDKGGQSAQTTVFAQGNTVRLSRNFRSGDHYTTVSFSQDSFTRRGRPIESPDERVTLRVRTTRLTEAQPPIEDIRVSAASFSELLQKSPGPSIRYLAPLLRSFGQDEAVFRVNPHIAWQVFFDSVEVNESVALNVRQLLTRLDDDDFRRRELATTDLEVLGGPAIAVINELDRERLTPEQFVRIDAILNRHAQLDEDEVAALQNDQEFLLRCFIYSEVKPLRAAAVERLERILGMEPGLSPELGLASRIRAVDEFRERQPAGQ